MDADVLQEARDACAAHRWDVAYDRYRSAADDDELAAGDLAGYADAAWWLGRTDESLALSEELYRRFLQGDAAPTAARLAIEIGFLWLLRGEPTVGSGWVSRATRLLAEVPECAEHGYLRYLDVLEALGSGALDRAVDLTRDIRGIAERHDDQTLCAIALVYEGIATVRTGRVAEGLALLDEAMLPVRAGVVRPNWAGNLYCQLMGLFMELADVPRARAWTEATERWCDQHSNAAMFIGICRIHRAQLLHLEGSWGDAERCAEQACRDLVDMNVEVVAAGHYEIGELRRVQGDLEGAERAFARAHDLGREPQPGLARLRLAQGQPGAAAAAIAASLAATDQPYERAPLLVAQLDIAEASQDASVADAAAQELTSIAEVFGTPGLVAAASQAAGTARLLADDPGGALPLLRDACRRWRDLDARYQAARVRVRLARASAAMGDVEGAEREQAAAQAILRDLGAATDLAELQTDTAKREPPGGLTPREVEVLRLVADGHANASIAQVLTISDRTVERHLSNIFLKLQVSSRIEAARFAYANGLADLG